MTKNPCCSPGRHDRVSASENQRPLPASAPDTAERLIQTVVLPGGAFMMGDHFDEGYAQDGENPVHRVELAGFDIDRTPITAAEFARFVAASGYETEAERYGTSAVFHLFVKAGEKEILGPVPGLPWWLTVTGADWAHPWGPDSEWTENPDHPVTHVSWNDAVAYCEWAGRALPTEAQWEYAARGGLSGKRFAWGDELTPGGDHQCNIWQGRFPVQNTADDGFAATSPVGTFPANGYGLFDMAGNVWHWCADFFDPGYYRASPIENPSGPQAGLTRVMRGGSHLCHDSYCNRYRVAARSSNAPDSSSSNTGFRTVSKP
ncbi:formylglycine-generating enzyme family protein [Micrococcoides hystricis]|uniref:Formylglycine-generating enzyme family protein n=1 Tax=Micrococcoides hystricis TaxID=1572761 RepID=A0ABV6PCX4_9MICC